MYKYFKNVRLISNDSFPSISFNDFDIKLLYCVIISIENNICYIIFFLVSELLYLAVVVIVYLLRNCLVSTLLLITTVRFLVYFETIYNFPTYVLYARIS